MATEIKMPQLGLTMEEGVVDRWLKCEGEAVKKGEPLFEVTTDKLTNEVEAEEDGILLKIIAKPGTEVKVQGLLGYIGEEGEKVPEAADQEEQALPSVLEEPKELQGNRKNLGQRIRISPLAKKIAAEKGIDYADIQGSGPGGRIVKQDILAAAFKKEKMKEERPKAVSGRIEPFPVKKLPLMEGDTAEDMSSMRQVIAKRMYASASEVPTVTQTMKADVTELVSFRAKINKGRAEKISINDFVLKAVAKSLRRNPKMLVSLDGNQVIHRAHVNLGMAVAVEEGLIVPVIKDADTLGLEALAKKTKDLAQRARNGQLNVDECSNSTFSVSNLGMYGVESFTPIINQPDAGILGINAMEDELMLDGEGKISIQKVMRISLTFDHRLVDGSTAAIFEKDVCRLLESPMDVVL